MKILLSSLFVVLLSLYSKGQSEVNTEQVETEVSVTPPSNLERYNIDFKILEWSQPDQAVLNQINLNQYEKFRNDSTDIDIELTSYSVTLRLFSRLQTLENESNSKVSLNYFHHLFVKEE